MLHLSTVLTVPLDDLEDTEVVELRQVITEKLASFNAVDVNPAAVFGWTPATASELQKRLVSANRPVQAKVIAAESHNAGQCDRETVYVLGGYPAERSLNGFTKPVRGIMRDMQAEGLLPLDAADPMKPIYDPQNPSFQKAQGFTMPAELAVVFNKAPDPSTV